MKQLPNVLLAIGVILLLLAAVGRFVGNPYRVLDLKVVTMILLGNTAVLLAVAAKLFEKK